MSHLTSSSSGLVRFRPQSTKTSYSSLPSSLHSLSTTRTPLRATTSPDPASVELDHFQSKVTRSPSLSYSSLNAPVTSPRLMASHMNGVRICECLCFLSRGCDVEHHRSWFVCELGGPGVEWGLTEEERESFVCSTDQSKDDLEGSRATRDCGRGISLLKGTISPRAGKARRWD